MAKYLKKKVTEESTENEVNAFIAVELKANLLTGIAHVKEGGWKTAEGLALGKDQAIAPILWVEPDINVLVTLMDYPFGTNVYDILFDTIGYRMQTLDSKPDGSGPNPFKGCTFEDIPGTVPSSSSTSSSSSSA